MAFICRNKIVKFKLQEKNNKHNMNKFMTKLNFETLDSVFDSNDVDSMSDYFHNTYFSIS